MSRSNPLKTGYFAEDAANPRRLYTGSAAALYFRTGVTKQDNTVRFSVFELHRDTRELRKHGTRIRLEDQPFSVLLALLENPGAVVTRAELRARIWPDGTFVDFDKSLTKAVNKIRAALDDSAATPRFVETLSRRGYRFIAPVISNGEPEQPVAEPPPPAPSRTLRRWIRYLVTILLFVLSLAIGSNLLKFRNRPDRMAPIQSLAVLPIVNLTGETGQEYFADALTDDLISDLSRIGSLRVISYTSAMHYKGIGKDLSTIARQLGVEGIVEGSIQRAGHRVRMNVRLVRAAADRQLWSDSYEGDLAEAAQLDGRVALAVAHQVSARLSDEAAERLAGRDPARSGAYDAYMHGRYLFNLRGREAILQAAMFFEQAVREDPGFAPAWSGLADRYTIGWNAGNNPVLAEQYARKAISLDPSLAEAHASLGFALECQYRFADAEPELKRAVELNPNYVPGHQFYAIHLLTLGRTTAALAQNDRCLELDPFSLPVNNLRGLILTGARDFEGAERYFQAAAATDPQKPDPLQNLARVYWIERRVAEAVAMQRMAATKTSGPSSEKFLRGLAEIEAALPKTGFHEACLHSARIMEQFEGSKRGSDVPLLYGLAGDAPKVLEWLERSTAVKGYANVYMLETAPEYDFLRADPRFRDLLRRIGLP